MQYLATQNYRASWKEGVLVLVAGETVTLDDDAAAHVQNDAPGALEPLAAQPAAQSAPSPAPVSADTATDPERALDEAPQDRQLKRAPKRAKDKTNE